MAKRKAPPGAWKPGQSGNPKGRPKHALKYAIQDALEAEHIEEIDGEQRKITMNRVFIEVLTEKAKEGDLRAIQMLWDRGYGKPTESIEMAGAAMGGVIVVERAQNKPAPKAR